jgi:hypothetical protein
MMPTMILASLQKSGTFWGSGKQFGTWSVSEFGFSMYRSWRQFA